MLLLSLYMLLFCNVFFFDDLLSLRTAIEVLVDSGDFQNFENLFPVVAK